MEPRIDLCPAKKLLQLMAVVAGAVLTMLLEMIVEAVVGVVEAVAVGVLMIQSAIPNKRKVEF